MPGAPRPPTKATRIALKILGRVKPEASRPYGNDEYDRLRQPAMKSKKFVSVGSQPIPHTFDGSLG